VRNTDRSVPAKGDCLTRDGLAVPVYAGCCRLLTLCWVILVLISPAAAQSDAPQAAPNEGAPQAAPNEGAPQAAPNEVAPSPGVVEESPLTTFVFRGEDGNLVEMPNFSFADFEKAYKLMRGLTQQDPRPRFSIQWLSLVGKATNSHAEMLLTIRVLTRDRHWVRVPLRLDQAMVQEPLESDDSVEAFLHPETEGEGYVCYVRGEPDQQHTIKLKLLVPLSITGERTRFVLRLPRATASELKLSVPMDEVVAEVSEGTTLLPPASAEGATELTVLGVGGDFRLLWHKPETDSVTMPAVLQADGAISTRMDGQTVTWNASVSVRSFGSPFDRFRLRLPPQSQLVPDNPTGYTVTALDTPEAEALLGRVVEVRLDKKTSGPVEVRVTARRVIEEELPGDWIDLAGFSVVDAVRQWGHLAVAVPSDWQVLWGPQRGVNRVDQLPEPLRREDLVAGFEYAMQPALLQARLVPKTTRLSVDPEYLVFAGAERTELRARLRYSIRGAKVFALQVHLPGWQLDSVEPENLVALDGVETDENGDVHIPLLQPTRGELEIVILAHRDVSLPTGESEPLAIEWPLPRPHADTSAAALVVILPDDNVGLAPDPAKTTGLVRQRTAPSIELPTRQQAPLCYRGELPDAVFAASARRLMQRIEVNTSSRIELHSSKAQIRQIFEYMILHEPAGHFLLEVPESLTAGDGLEVLHEGVAVPLRPRANEAAENEGPTVILQADLPEPCIGRCELVLSYAVPLSPPPDRDGLSVPVPLIVPHDANPNANRLSLVESADLFAEVVDDAWSRAEQPAVPEPSAVREAEYAATGRRHHVSLRMGPQDSLRLGTTVVERAWVQTWLIRTDRSDRQDRAVFRVRSRRNRLEATLPEGTAMEQVFVWLNLERIEDFAIDGNRLYIPLPGNGTPQTHILELGYHFVEPADRHGPLSVELPQIDNQVWVRRLYWQLVLPRHEHVIAAPEGFTSESPWRWTGYLFARQPLMEQPELEQWVGAARRSPVSHETNRYVYSTSGFPKVAVLRTANRSWVVLGASGLALVVGLMLIYVPASRHPATLLVIAVGLACVGVLYPAPTLLIAQAAGLGLGLTLLAGLLERSVARGRATLSAPGGRPGPEGDSTLTQHDAVRPGDPTSTQTASIGVGSRLPQDAFP
jgi:hypothetical protein